MPERDNIKKKKKKLDRVSPSAGLPIFGDMCICECMICVPGYSSRQTKAKRESLIKIRFLDVAQPYGAGKMIGLWRAQGCDRRGSSVGCFINNLH